MEKQAEWKPMRIPKSDVKIDTWEYTTAHLHAPRGQGYWAFFMRCMDRRYTYWANGKYSECKRDAIAYAAEHGFIEVKLGS